jgi:hypothetical protein
VDLVLNVALVLLAFRGPSRPGSTVALPEGVVARSVTALFFIGDFGGGFFAGVDIVPSSFPGSISCTLTTPLVVMEPHHRGRSLDEEKGGSHG